MSSFARIPKDRAKAHELPPPAVNAVVRYLINLFLCTRRKASEAFVKAASGGGHVLISVIHNNENYIRLKML